MFGYAATLVDESATDSIEAMFARAPNGAASAAMTTASVNARLLFFMASFLISN